MIEQILESLRARGLRITQARRALIKIFAAEKHPVTAKELIDALAHRNQSVNKTTVYREVDRLLEQGIIRRIQFHDRAARFELVRGDHHHHIVCTECERVEDIDLEPHLKREEEQLKKQTGFRNIRHALEFFGICTNCQKI